MNIHELRDTFSKHAEINRKSHHDRITFHIINYPHDPLPKYLTDDFDLSAALEVICQEIINLKAQLSE